MTPRQAERFVAEVLAELDLRARVRGALSSRQRAETIIAIGKAAAAMAKGALDRQGGRVERVIVVLPDGTASLGLERDQRVELLRARHPVPDARSVRAGERCLDAAARAVSLVVLVSGGASALVSAPTVPLRDKQRVTQVFLRSGATIAELNVVRKHLSRIKGGGLARATARRTPVLTLCASDVIGGEPGDIGSGPSIGDTSSTREARVLLRRYAPELAALPLVRTGPAPGRARVIASPEEMARIAKVALEARGLDVRILRPSTEPVEALAEEYLARAARLPPGSAVVRAAEPSLRVTRGRERGRGGRSTHLAALVGRALPRGVTFLGAASDGVDGVSGTAGACVRADFAEEAAIARSLRSFATGDLHRVSRTALRARPSGHNLADLHVLLRE